MSVNPYPSRGQARIGVLVPFTNSNLEADMALMRPAGVSMHFARLGGYDADEIPDAEQMAGLGVSDLQEPLRLLSGVRPDVVIYGCTSATLTHGYHFDQQLAAHIHDYSQAHAVTAAGALVHALKSLQVENIGFASPYVPLINQQAIDFLAECGFKTFAHAAVEEELDNQAMGALAPEQVLALGKRADHPQAEAIVLSCTDMRSVEVIADLEATLQKPVVTSNQAMLFKAMQYLNLPATASDRVAFGRLFEKL